MSLLTEKQRTPGQKSAFKGAVQAKLLKSTTLSPKHKQIAVDTMQMRMFSKCVNAVEFTNAVKYFMPPTIIKIKLGSKR